MNRTFKDYATIAGAAALCIAILVKSCKSDYNVYWFNKRVKKPNDDIMIGFLEETHEVLVEPDSKGEDLFMSVIYPKCIDKVACRLGAIFGLENNHYVLTERDFKMAKDFALEYGSIIVNS